MQFGVAIHVSGALLTGDPAATLDANIEAAVTEATHFLEAQIKMRTPHRTGNLSKSIQAEDIQGKGTPVVKGIVATSQSYALPVETGTGIYGPKKVPFVIKAKPGKALIWPGADHPVKQVTIKGMVGAHMFENGFKDNTAGLDRIFAKYGLKIVTELSQ